MSAQDSVVSGQVDPEGAAVSQPCPHHQCYPGGQCTRDSASAPSDGTLSAESSRRDEQSLSQRPGLAAGNQTTGPSGERERGELEEPEVPGAQRDESGAGAGAGAGGGRRRAAVWNAVVRDVRGFRSLPREIQLLLLTQLAFNVGFYLVVPFLANYMTDSLAATGAVVGFVLGLRTFSQQGLFFVGGGLTDRFGVKPVLLTGIAIRVAGFVWAGLSTSVASLMVAVVLIGFAAALFSPAAEAAFAEIGREVERSGGMPRSELFAMDSFFSRVGALTGPLLGAALIEQGFPVTCFVAAGIFAALFIAHSWVVPPIRTQSHSGVLRGYVEVLGNRVFLLFAVAYSTGLMAYNQQYLSLPVELRRASGSAAALGLMFVFSSVLNLSLQMPLARVARAMGQRRAVAVGFGLQALGFAVVAAASVFFQPASWLAFTPAMVMLVCLHTGQMIAVPVSRDLVGVVAGEKNLGTYFGFLNSFGGVAVLLTSMVVGSLLDHAEITGPAACVPWLVLTGAMAASAVALPRIVARAQRPVAG